MRKVKKVEESKVNLNQDNIPSQEIPNDKITLVESNRVKDLLNIIPNLDSEDFVLIIYFIGVYLFGRKFFISSTELIYGLGIFSIILLFLMLASLSKYIVGIYVTDRKNLYILSEDYVISTFSGRERVGDSNIKSLNLNDVKDIEFGDKEITFRTEDSDLKIRGVTDRSIKEIQNYLYF